MNVLRRIRTRHAVPIVLLVFSILTLLLRTWRLESIPPWLWWDEATQGVDARELLHGHFQVFFPSALGKEPLYVYLTTPFVAAWDGHPAAVRLAGALLGALMIPVLYLSLIHISEPTRLGMISYAVFCLKKKKQK